MECRLKNTKEEINLNTLAIIFVLVLLTLFGAYFVFYVAPPFFIERYPINTFTINNSQLSINGFVLDSFEFESCTDCILTYHFEEGDYFIVDYEMPYKNKINALFRKVFYHIFGIPPNGWISIDFKPSNTNWSEHNSINFFVKGTGVPSKLEFDIQEADGDTWHYFDKDILKTKKWALVNINFEDLTLSRESSGDGKKELNDVEVFNLIIISSDRAVNNTLYFALEDNSLFYLL